MHLDEFRAAKDLYDVDLLGQLSSARERFLAHRIEAAPDMDQIVRIDGSATGAALDEGRPLRRPRARGLGELRVGDRVGRARVERVLYTEYADLAR